MEDAERDAAAEEDSLASDADEDEEDEDEDGGEEDLEVEELEEGSDAGLEGEGRVTTLCLAGLFGRLLGSRCVCSVQQRQVVPQLLVPVSQLVCLLTHTNTPHPLNPLRQHPHSLGLKAPNAVFAPLTGSLMSLRSHAIGLPSHHPLRSLPLFRFSRSFSCSSGANVLLMGVCVCVCARALLQTDEDGDLFDGELGEGGLEGFEEELSDGDELEDQLEGIPNGNAVLQAGEMRESDQVHIKNLRTAPP